MARKKRRIYSEKKRSVKGIISLVIGIISLIVLLILFYLSAKEDGNSGIVMGLVGIIILISSIVGLVLGYQGYKEKDIEYREPVIGLILNGLIFLTLFILYTVGLFR